MIHAICVRGKDHVSRNEKCQDRIYIYQSSEKQIIVIADGMGSYKMSGKFAEYIVPKISLWCRDNETVVFTGLNHEVRGAIGTYIHDIVEGFKSEHGMKTADFGSTLIILYQSFIYKKVAVLHVGDGAVLGIPKGDCQFATAISSPENYDRATISLENEAHMRVLRFDCDDYIALLAGTDGGMLPFINSDIAGFASTYVDYTIRRILNGETDLGNIIKEEHYEKSDIGDDISLVVLDTDKKPDEYEKEGFIKIFSSDYIESPDNMRRDSLRQASANLRHDIGSPDNSDISSTDLEHNDSDNPGTAILQINESPESPIRREKGKKKRKNKMGLSIYVISAIFIFLSFVTVSGYFLAKEDIQELKQEYTKINNEIDTLKNDLKKIEDQQERIENELVDNTVKDTMTESSATLQY